MVHDILITKENPFENDVLNFRDHIHQFCSQFIFRKIPLSAVVGITGEWGTGKSTYLKMLQMHAEGKNKDVIYFNAWKYEFYEDPLIAIYFEMESKFKEVLTLKKYKKVLNDFKLYGTQFIKSVLINSISYVSEGIINLQDTKDNVKKIKEKQATLLEKRIEDLKGAKELVDRFSDSIATLAKIINENTDSPLIIIIDELDRCLPPHALKLLERIKHILSVPGVVFIIAYDKNQLSHSLKTLYGNDFNIEGYLIRIIDHEVAIPSLFSAEYFNKCADKVVLSNNIYIDKFDESYKGLNPFAVTNILMKLSLRDQQYIMHNIYSLNNKNKNITKISYLLVYFYFLGGLKLKNPSVFKLFESGTITKAEFYRKVLPALNPLERDEVIIGGAEILMAIVLTIISLIEGEQNPNNLTSLNLNGVNLEFNVHLVADVKTRMTTQRITNLKNIPKLYSEYPTFSLD
ncbi:MAG: hypothetical protein HRU80_01465 [Ignavibacteriales bacterium]|nr:MAG: hypothetical protein HRU80_01465 [Ignavibacteriales bacterium]